MRYKQYLIISYLLDHMCTISLISLRSLVFYLTRIIVMKQSIIVALLLVSTLTLFSDDSAVFKLTTKNFKSAVLESDEFWLV